MNVQEKENLFLSQIGNSNNLTDRVRKLKIIYIVSLGFLPLVGINYIFQHIFIFHTSLSIITFVLLGVVAVGISTLYFLIDYNSIIGDIAGKLFFYFTNILLWIFTDFNLFNPGQFNLDAVTPAIFIIIVQLAVSIIYDYKDLTIFTLLSIGNFVIFSFVYLPNNLIWAFNSIVLILICYVLLLLSLYFSIFTERRLFDIAMEEEIKKNSILEQSKNNIMLYNSITHELLTPIHCIQANLSKLQSDYEISFSSDTFVSDLNSILDSIKFWTYYLIDFNELNNFFVFNNEKIKLFDLKVEFDYILVNNPDFIKNKVLIFVDSPNETIIIDKIRFFLILMDSIKSLSNYDNDKDIIINLNLIKKSSESKLNIIISQKKINTFLNNKTGENNILKIDLYRKLIQQMNGNFSFESSPDISIYYIQIPCKLKDSNSYEQFIVNKKCINKKMSILIADDLDDNRFIIKSFLNEFNIIFTEATNGVEALQILKTQKFDLVFMDIRMPVIDGISSTRQYREWEKMNRFTKTPIVFLTAYLNDIIDSNELLELVDNRIINKPFKKENLMKIICEIVSKA